MNLLEKILIGIGILIILFELTILILQGFMAILMGVVFGNKALVILYDLVWRQ